MNDVYRGAERRLDPRVDTEVVLEVTLSNGDTEEKARLVTKNLSSSGALCISPVPLPLKGLLPGRLLLPDAARGGIETDVIVLRIQPRRAVAEASFVVALYFVDMRPADREAIRRFVFERLSCARDPVRPAAGGES